MPLTLKSAGAIVQRLPAQKGELMEVKVLNQIFVNGDLVLPDDIIDVSETDAINLVNIKEAEFLPDDYQPPPEALREEAAKLRKKADGLEYQAEEIEIQDSEKIDPATDKPADEKTAEPTKKAKK